MLRLMHVSDLMAEINGRNEALQQEEAITVAVHPPESIAQVIGGRKMMLALRSHFPYGEAHMVQDRAQDGKQSQRRRAPGTPPMSLHHPL